MKKEVVLLTGASSGIGREMAKHLSRKGHTVLLVARRRDRLEQLAASLPSESYVIEADLSKEDQWEYVYEEAHDKGVTVLINCAGFGLYGTFVSSSLEKELEMVDVNVKAVLALSKWFLQDFVAKDYGYILTVSSVAGLMPGGPYMAAYYASKAYVTNWTLAVQEELQQAGSSVVVSALCPGPVETEFNEVAGATFGLKSITAEECAVYGINQLFNKKTIIVPGFTLKAAVFLAKIAPRKVAVKIAAHTQRKKGPTN